MGLRDTIRRVRQEWAETPVPAPKPARKPAAGECSQSHCSNPVKRDGVCGNCWTAIYGGIV